MKRLLNSSKLFILKHKVWSLIIVAVFAYGIYYEYKNLTSTAGEKRYITSAVTRGTIVSSINGSGQVAALNQIDIKPKVSGAITYVGIRPNTKVGTGQLLFTIDNATALKSIRDAEVNLESAKISFEQLKIQKSSDNMSADLAQSYDSGFNSVSSVFLDLPGIMNGLNDMFFKGNVSTGQWNINWYEGQVPYEDHDKALLYKQDFQEAYNLALSAYTKSSDIYKSTSRTSSDTAVENLILTTYDTVKLISNAVKNANSYVDFVNDSMQKHNLDLPALITSHKALLNTYTSKTNTHLVTLLNVKTDIKNNKDAFPAGDLDIQSAQLSIKQRENALQDAKDNLENYYVRSPFAGTIASVPAQKGDNASGSATLATIITTQKIANVSLNEVDVSKISLGQKVTLTFDAIPDLIVAGVVAQIDSIGTVSSGVVNYNVKIGFDTTDLRVKPGMSVAAAIITDVRQDILVVPNSAVKTQGSSKYVEAFDSTLPAPLPGVQGSPSAVAPKQIPVQIGVSNDLSTEIISGLKENDEIVTKTITGGASTATTAPSIFGAATGGARAGTAVRATTVGR